VTSLPASEGKGLGRAGGEARIIRRHVTSCTSVLSGRLNVFRRRLGYVHAMATAYWYEARVLVSYWRRARGGDIEITRYEGSDGRVKA
jgi:hypothetical protein